MYGQTVKKALRVILDEYPAIKGPTGKHLKPGERNKLIDHLLFELWMRGFAVSARTPGLRPGFQRDGHDAWRNRKLGRPSTYNQTDVEEVQAKISPEGASGHLSTSGP